MSSTATEADNILLLRGELPKISRVTPLIQAAAAGDSTTLRTLCQQSTLTQINHSDSLIGNALTWAAIGGHSECVTILLEAGAWPNTTSPLHGSPLNQAILRGHTTCVSLLMAANADPQLALPKTLAPHYEYGKFICLKSHSKRETAASIASYCNDQRLKGYIKLDPRYPLPSLNLPAETIDTAELQQWVNFWVNSPKENRDMLYNRINNLRSETTLKTLCALLEKQIIPKSITLWKSPHQQSKVALINQIAIRIAQINRIKSTQPSHQLDALAGS